MNLYATQKVNVVLFAYLHKNCPFLNNLQKLFVFKDKIINTFKATSSWRDFSYGKTAEMK